METLLDNGHDGEYAGPLTGAHWVSPSLSPTGSVSAASTEFR